MMSALWCATLDLARMYRDVSRRSVENNGPAIVFVQNARKLWEKHCLPVLPILFLYYSPNSDDDERVFAFSTDKGAFQKFNSKRVRFAV
jgi:streptogramin lyase